MSRSHLPAWVFLAALLPAKVDAQTLQLEAITEAEREVEVFGDGNVKGAVGQADAATAAAGSLGMRFRDGTFISTGLINIAGTHKTATRSLGATLLSPATGGPLNAGLVDVRLPRLLSVRTCRKTTRTKWHDVLCTFGLHIYGSVATTGWATLMDDSGAVTDSVDVPFWGFGLGPSVTFFSEEIGTGDNKKAVSMVLDAGFVSRHLRGDLFTQDTVRVRLIGTKKRDFYGLELGLGLQFGNVRSGFSYYFLNGDVPGLSNGQVVAGVSIQASLIGGPVNHKKETQDDEETPDEETDNDSDTETDAPPPPPPQ
jgi:hypothetical protein